MSTSLLRNSVFTRFWIGDVSATLANQMVVLAVGWQIYDLTNSAMSLGLVGLTHFSVQFLGTLPSGHFADRHDRRLVAFACQALQCTAALLLATAYVHGWTSPPLIYGCVALSAVGLTFQTPAMRSLLPSLVPIEQLPRCIAFHAAVKKGAVIAGPALGGAVYLAGASAVYFGAAATFVVAGLVILSIRAGAASRSREPATLRYMLGGLSYMVRHPILLGAITLDLFATLLGGAVALLPIYARDILHAGPAGLGLLRSAPALGAVVASLWLVRFPLTRHVGRVLFFSVTGFGVCTVVFGFSTWLPLSLLALAFMGLSDMVSVVIRSSLVQLETPDAMRGRVNAVHSLFTGTSNQLGQFESGLTAAWWGTVPAVVVGGLGTLVVVGLWLRWFPQLLARNTLNSPAAHVTASPAR